ncbi:MAG: helix-turn-helix domain-containing protein [Pseudonocardiales bacterium]|nr:helix-turn-helix domain-containing protein [Pseudonocardiales bacterium]MBV9729167.1 helix-turn-helix domain-containing protein [Pseudonocardiales bacterium]
MAIAVPLPLREGDRVRLEALARSASARPSVAQRARIVLMSAEGLTNTEIARRTGSTRPTVISWRNRYATGGISALGDLPRSGRPAVVDELEVVATTLADGGRPPAHLGVNHWSSRLLGQQLGISFATVARIWRKWGIQPAHVETFTFSNDLKRQAQTRDLSGLYFNLYQRAAALHRPALASAAEGQPAVAPDPWLKLVEVSLGIITQQAIRRGTFASVRNLIDALGALTDGWQDRHKPTGRPSAAETTVGNRGRQTTSDTPRDLHKGSSRLAESGRPRDLDRSAGRTRDSKSVRAEFHGTRGRRSGTTSRPGS